MVSPKAIVSSQIIGTFVITYQGRKTSELIKLGKYTDADLSIGDERFRTQRHMPVTRTIELVKCHYWHNLQEGLAELAHYGLRCPRFEDALEFGVQHPEEQRNWRLVFPHKPVLDRYGRPIILTLTGDAGRRFLSTARHENDTRLPENYVLAGVRK